MRKNIATEEKAKATEVTRKRVLSPDGERVIIRHRMTDGETITTTHSDIANNVYTAEGCVAILKVNGKKIVAENGKRTGKDGLCQKVGEALGYTDLDKYSIPIVDGVPRHSKGFLAFFCTSEKGKAIGGKK